METSLASLDFSMYPPETETLTLKEIFECNYEQPGIGGYYSLLTATHPPAHGMVRENFSPYGTPPQSVSYDVGQTCDSFVPQMYARTTNSSCHSGKNQPATTNLFSPTPAFGPHKPTPTAVSSTLPTPPQSPPSNETDLDNIIATFPEILEFPPSFLFPAVEDVLFDLETSPCGQMDYGYPSVFSQEERTSPLKPQQQDFLNHREYASVSEQIPKALKKDSMWGGGPPILTVEDDQRLKARTVSESSEDYRQQCVYSDEEYENLPDTPCVSDEDVEHLDTKEVSSSLNNITAPIPAAPSTPAGPSPAYQAAPHYANSVSNEHNYCEKSPVESYSQDNDSDEEVDVVSYEVPPKSCSSSPSPSSPLFRGPDTYSGSLVSSPLTATLPHSPSSQVKRQLQIVIHESLKNRQKKGRVGRPPKSLKASSPSTPASSFPIDVASDVSGTLLKGHNTQGKPASYTKRMREQHSEVLKTNKRRRTTSKDLECDSEKRSNHNIMERNRRVNIKLLFDMLRQNVPEIKDNERASKVLILNKSREYIEQLERSSLRLDYEHTTESEKNQFFKKRLQALQGLRH